MSAHMVSEERQALRTMVGDAAKRVFRDNVTPDFLQRFRNTGDIKALWELVEETGLGHALANSIDDPDALRFADVFELFHGIGYWQVPLPLTETVLAREILAAADADLPDGPITIYAPIDPAKHWENVDGNWQFKGPLENVPWASASDHLLAVDPDQNWGLYALAGQSIQTGVNVAKEPRDTITPSGDWRPIASGKIPHLDQAGLLARVALVRAIAMCGAMECALERTIAYLGERSQFGRTLSRFQVLQHAVAEMTAEIATARTACRVAAETASLSLTDARLSERLLFDVAVAKICAGKATATCVRATHQMHGAIGFTREHPLHYATQLLWALRAEAGSESFWASRLGKAAISVGGSDFWAALTDRRITPRI